MLLLLLLLSYFSVFSPQPLTFQEEQCLHFLMHLFTISTIVSIGDQKRNLHKEAQNFVLEDGALFFIGQKNGQSERRFHNRDEQQQILITRYGVAEIVMSDQGQEFVDRVNEVLFKLCRMDHRIRSAC